jgi:hypothetical protein
LGVAWKSCRRRQTKRQKAGKQLVGETERERDR